MRRVIYCPSEKFLDEAVKISKVSNLQIMIGECEDSKSLSFDRNQVQVILIPDQYGLYYQNNVKKNFHQIVSYYNDYTEFTKNIILKTKEKEIKPHILEKHFVKFIYTCDNIGDYEDTIIDKDVREELIFYVD